MGGWALLSDTMKSNTSSEAARSLFDCLFLEKGRSKTGSVSSSASVAKLVLIFVSHHPRRPAVAAIDF
jgi:hypothetical protein